MRIRSFYKNIIILRFILKDIESHLYMLNLEWQLHFNITLLVFHITKGNIITGIIQNCISERQYFVTLCILSINSTVLLQSINIPFAGNNI